MFRFSQSVRSVEVNLTRIEFDILHLLMSSPQRVYTYEQIFRHVWGMNIQIIQIAHFGIMQKDLGNTIIYGDHMKNGTMFSSLESYKNKDFYESHKIIRFDTLGGYGEYEIIAVFKTVAYSDAGFKYYEFDNAADETAFKEYVAKCKELSFYDTGLSADYNPHGRDGNKLITLSACEYSNQNGRLVVVAKKISE